MIGALLGVGFQGWLVRVRVDTLMRELPKCKINCFLGDWMSSTSIWHIGGGHILLLFLKFFVKLGSLSGVIFLTPNFPSNSFLVDG